MRATGIFTGTTSSPCQSARQSHFRYAIRAGRNLPDKEFRSTLLRLLSHQFVLGRARLSVVPLDVPSIAALAAEVRSFDLSMIWEVERTFLPLSACRHAVRTISFPPSTPVILSEAKNPMPADITTGFARNFYLGSFGVARWNLAYSL